MWLRLVAGQEHGDALRQHQRREEIALLLPAQGVDGGIVGWALGPTVPTVVLIGAVLVLVAIRVVMLVIVTDQIVERKAVVAGDKIDAGRGLAPVMLIQSLLPLSRVANSDNVPPSPFQNRRTVSRYLPFHSLHKIGKLPTW